MDAKIRCELEVIRVISTADIIDSLLSTLPDDSDVEYLLD